MPLAFDQLKASPKKVKTINSAYDSESFDADGTIHVDGLVGSATISPSGRDVALVSPEGLAIIDLDSPYSPPRRLSSHGLPWLVVDVQWSPFAFRDYWVASTANHRCLVWNLNLRDDSTSGAIEHSLQGHSRAITDINFSAHHPDLLATCAVDGYVHCWDLRRPRQPALTFCDWFAGATQVKYSRQDPFIIASSHDRWLHIWDERKSSEPLRSISAHTSKIYGIDWNRFIATSIVTCSLDKSIKFWDYSKSDEVPERVIRTDFPVWRARHTPFGTGLLAMPQNEPGNLYLFNRRLQPDTPKDGVVEPVATFQGHGDHKVKEFLWRSRGTIDDGIDNREFQMVSWGEDNKLRLTRPEPSVLESVGYVKGMAARKNLVITRKGATYKTFRTVDDGSHHRRTATMSDPRAGGIRQSALTQGMKIPPSRTGPSWRGPSMKAKNSGTGKMDRSQAQMNWMRGITMTKRKSGTDSPQRVASKDSTMFGLGFHDDHWGEPESLQEEFVRISTQLPNVKWDSIDMDTLILNASLKGPWGVDGDDIFIKVKVDIPHAYPKSKAPKFIIDKNAFMPAGTHEKLEMEVHQIAQQYLKRKQNCLAAAFIYLLGEADLTQSTTFFKNVRDLDDEMDVLADESSSEDSDNDIPAGASASMSMSQELSASTDIGNPLAPSNRPAIPPVIRTAGARFSNDGRLVCFFPTKDAKALLFSPNDNIKERPKDQPTFAGFGRLTEDSPPPRQRYLDGEASTTDVLSALSDDSEDSSSSSDSELTTMHKISLWYRPGRGLHKTWSANGSLRSSAAGTGPGTGTGTGTSRRRPGRPKSIVSIHDIRYMLPSKKEFAEEYSIFGDGAQVCEHNAQVAEKYGYYDLVNIWRYSALLLRSDIPLELHEHYQRNKSVLVIAKDALSRYQGGGWPKNEGEHLTGRVKWGHHPLAQDFVSDLFDYFEQIADVQMLAMLSCIFGESSTEHSVPYAESHLTQPETPLAMKAPSFSLEYFPTDTVEWGLERRSGYSSAVTTPGTVHTPVIFSDTDSPDVLWLGDPGSQSYSTGETPPHRSFKDHLSDIDPNQSLSTSPNDRSIRRSQSALAPALTPISSRGFTSVASSSPPGRKRPSPAERIMENISHIQGNITWGGSTYFGAPSEHTETARTSVSDDEFRRDELVSMIPMSVTVTVEDETAFDDDGWLATPLLDPSRHPNYASYRYAYAEMLQMWRLPLTRLEIMKFNVLKEDNMEQLRRTSAESSYHESATHDTSQSGTGTTSPTILLGGKREQLQALQASGRGLDVTGICRVHEIQLRPLQYSQSPSPGGAVGVCERCRRPQSQLTCVLCREPINALYPACLGCGCVFHEGCIAEWHAMGETECPAADDCECVEEADRGQVETWIALRAAMGLERKGSGRAQTSHGEKNNNGRGRSGSGGSHGAKPSIGNSFGSAASISIANRLRRRSAPAPFLLPAEEDDEETLPTTPQPDRPASPSRFRVVRSPSGREDDFEGVSPIYSMNSTATPTKPSPLGPGISAARVSLGNRLKSLEAQRPGLPQRRSGGYGAGNGTTGSGKKGGN